ncbi:MAG: polyketide cyclase, partial [Brevundimonas sp.]
MAQDTDNNPCDTDGVAHEHSLTLRRVFDATPEQIWTAWTTPEILQQ